MTPDEQEDGRLRFGTLVGVVYLGVWVVLVLWGIWL